jgi:hypothetical protein
MKWSSIEEYRHQLTYAQGLGESIRFASVVALASLTIDNADQNAYSQSV